MTAIDESGHSIQGRKIACSISSALRPEVAIELECVKGVVYNPLQRSSDGS